MKTRKKITKSPVKGRRSITLCVKKSPIICRNLSRNIENVHTSTKATAYESPLNHLYRNGPAKLFTSTNLFRNKELKVDIDNTNKNEQRLGNTKNLLSISNNFVDLVQKKEDNKKRKVEIKNLKNNMDTISTQTTALSKCNKRDIFSVIAADDMPHVKKKKVSKGPLSRINDINEANNFSDSIIFLDDTELQPVTKILLSDSEKSTVFSETEKNSVNIKPLTNSEEVVVIDCNDSTFIEMEAYNNTLNKNINSPTTSSQLMNSVIIIDPDDESPARTNRIPKFNEDCFVVWSSLSKPCTSKCTQNTKPPRLDTYSLVNESLQVSNSNKIITDTQADLTNLKYLNNENDKPLKKKAIKSPKITKGVKKSIIKTMYTKTKLSNKPITELSPRPTVKSKKKPITEVTKKPSMKIRTKTKTKYKNRTKNNGELIFLSESKEDNNTIAKTTKFKKGTLREIVIDGSNVAMAYTKNKIFSEKGIKMLIDYFTKKGHTVKVFVPQYRRSYKFPLLEKWHTEGIVIFTPSRQLGNKSFTPYDDRYILEYATACNGIVVSQDQFRDLYFEKPQYRDTIENRLLVPTFVGEYVMFPEDPLGRDGPTLANFLKH